MSAAGDELPWGSGLSPSDIGVDSDIAPAARAKPELIESEEDSQEDASQIQDAGWDGGQHEWLDPIRWICVNA